MWVSNNTLIISDLRLYETANQAFCTTYRAVRVWGARFHSFRLSDNVPL